MNSEMVVLMIGEINGVMKGPSESQCRVRNLAQVAVPAE